MPPATVFRVASNAMDHRTALVHEHRLCDQRDDLVAIGGRCSIDQRSPGSNGELSAAHRLRALICLALDSRAQLVVPGFGAAENRLPGGVLLVLVKYRALSIEPVDHVHRMTEGLAILIAPRPQRIGVLPHASS